MWGIATKMLTPVLAVALVMGLAAFGVFVLVEFTVLGDVKAKSSHNGHKRIDRIYGKLERLPNGHVGEWMVNGREIHVTRETNMKYDKGNARVGDYIVADCSINNGRLTAYKVEITSSGNR